MEIGSVDERKPAAFETAPTPAAGSNEHRAKEVGVVESAQRLQEQAGLLGGDAKADAELLAELFQAFEADEIVGAVDTLNEEAVFNFFLVLCDTLKRLALSGALDETEASRALAEKMDELKDQVIGLQDDIQQAVAEVKKAEAAARRTGTVNTAMAWAGVVTAALGAVLTAGASTPLLAAAVAGAVCAAVNASLQTAVFAGAENIDPSSDSYKRTTKALMGLELVLCLGAPSLASFAGPKSIKALIGMGSKPAKTVADDMADDVLRSTLESLPQQEFSKFNKVEPSPLLAKKTKSTAVKLDKSSDGQKPTTTAAGMVDEATRELPMQKLDAKVPPAAQSQQGQSGTGKLDDKPAELAAKSDHGLEPDKAKETTSNRVVEDQNVSVDQGFGKEARKYDAEDSVLDGRSANLNYQMQCFAALIEAIQVVGQMTASVVNIKTSQRVTKAQDESMSLKSKSHTAENALAHVEQDRMLANQRRSGLRYVDANFHNAQLDLIQQDREIGLRIAEWRRF